MTVTTPATDAPPVTSPPTIWSHLGHLPHSLEYVEVGPWSTRVFAAGPRGARPVFLLPGTGGHLEAYGRNIPTLAETHRVYAYDYPGHGWTTLAREDLELADYVAHLAGLMDALGLERGSLIGESLGGWVAVKFAVAHPDRVDRLVLDTPGGTMATPEVMKQIQRLSQAAADDPTLERVRARLEWLMADPSSVTDELVHLRRGVYSRPGFDESMRHILCLQEPEVRRRNMITDEELRAVAAPTLVVWTSDDPSGPAAAGLRMAELIPGGSFQLIRDAGHWPQWEQAERFNRAVAEFLG